MLRSADKGLVLGRDLGQAVQPNRYPVPLWDDGAAQIIGPGTGWSIGCGFTNGGTTAAFPAANDAICVPFRVPYPVTVEKVAMGTGTGTGNNFDIGVYNEAGTLLVSTGATARPAATTGLVVDVTDTVLNPGLYYMALASDSTSTFAVNTVLANVATVKMAGMRKQATAYPLPNPITFATCTAAYIPLIGLYVRPNLPSPASAYPFRFPPLNVITPFSWESQGAAFQVTNQTFATAASYAPGSNLALYVPFRLYERATAVKMSALVGTTSNGNMDAGIYDANRNRIVNSGSTAQGSTSSITEFDITDTTLEAGYYYMAVQLSSGTGTLFREIGNDEFQKPGWRCYTQAVGSFGLPTTATMTDATAGDSNTPVIGVHFSTLV
jgi:hypothetical protein